MVAQSESVPSTAANSGPCGTQRLADAPGAAGSSGNMGATSPVAMVIPQAQSVPQAQAALAGGVSSTPAQATGNATRSQPSVTIFQDYQRSPVVDTWHQLQHKQLATPPAPSPALPLSRITNAPQWWTLGINSSTSNWQRHPLPAQCYHFPGLPMLPSGGHLASTPVSTFNLDTDRTDP